ncbi:MAG: nuclear transport factor 2 family protein [Chthoniobacterales bacterium]|nr:nuclear transport factor 2 family protein [Chthoniobacterales bacterium]
MTLKHLIPLLTLAALLPLNATAQSADETAAIKAPALDYIESWYEGNPDRMQRALHPDLAKRIVERGPDGKSELDHMTAEKLVEGVRRGGGKKTPPEKQQKDITILDVYEKIAAVKIVASGWVDYLHIAKYDDRWVIINVLWEMKPKPAAALVPAFRAAKADPATALRSE